MERPVVISTSYLHGHTTVWPGHTLIAWDHVAPLDCNLWRALLVILKRAGHVVNEAPVGIIVVKGDATGIFFG